MNTAEICESLQQVISNYAPSDHESALFQQGKADALRLMELDNLSSHDKITVAGLLPPALLSGKIIDILIESVAPSDNELVTLIKNIIAVPCVSSTEKADRKRWLRTLLKSSKHQFSEDDRHSLSFAYISCIGDDQEDILLDEAQELAAHLHLCIRRTLEKYAAETLVFAPQEVEALLRSAAANAVLHLKENNLPESAQTVISLVLFLRDSVLQGKISDLSRFSDSWDISKTHIEKITREIALYEQVRRSTQTSISFTVVEEILTGVNNSNPSAAFDAYHDHKVVRHLMFVDGTCKLDEVQHSIILNAHSMHDAGKRTMADLQDALLHLKSQLELATKA